jgi:lipid-A-disaccharide synthase
MSAVEVSADVHASYLARELKGCDLFGMGGEKMREAGVDIRMDITEKSSVGIIEALKHIPSHIITINKLKRMIRDERPYALILIDAQGLNMIIAEYAKKRGIKTIYYIAPQEWLWGTKKGVDKVVKTIDLIISIFKKEHEVYKSAGGNSVYYGHPLLDIAKPTMNKMQFCSKFGLDQTKTIIALCPGSRVHEIRNFLPILADVAKRFEGTQFVMLVSSSKFSGRIRKYISGAAPNIKVIEGNNYDVIANSDLVIAKSGTIILECVCLGTPVIMFYKFSPLTYYIAKKFMKINLPYYSMPNLLVNKMVVPEFVMKDATADNIYREAVRILDNPRKIKASYEEVRSLMGSPGAVKKSAQKIMEFVEK